MPGVREMARPVTDQDGRDGRAGTGPSRPPPRGKRPASVEEAVNRYQAIRLLELGVRASDIRWLCKVPDYFLRRIERDLARRGLPAAPRRRRCRGCAPGVWSLVRSRPLRLEAALFAADWTRAGLPFATRPEPAALHEVYRHYRRWHWQDERREPLEPSACLALVQLVATGSLLLARCRHCRQLSVLPAPAAVPLASVTEACSFCGGPHPSPCRLGTDGKPPPWA